MKKFFKMSYLPVLFSTFLLIGLKSVFFTEVTDSDRFLGKKVSKKPLYNYGSAEKQLWDKYFDLEKQKAFQSDLLLIEALGKEILFSKSSDYSNFIRGFFYWDGVKRKIKNLYSVFFKNKSPIKLGFVFFNQEDDSWHTSIDLKKYKMKCSRCIIKKPADESIRDQLWLKSLNEGVLPISGTIHDLFHLYSFEKKSSFMENLIGYHRKIPVSKFLDDAKLQGQMIFLWEHLLVAKKSWHLYSQYFSKGDMLSRNYFDDDILKSIEKDIRVENFLKLKRFAQEYPSFWEMIGAQVASPVYYEYLYGEAMRNTLLNLGLKKVARKIAHNNVKFENPLTLSLQANILLEVFYMLNEQKNEEISISTPFFFRERFVDEKDMLVKYFKKGREKLLLNSIKKTFAKMEYAIGMGRQIGENDWSNRLYGKSRMKNKNIEKYIFTLWGKNSRMAQLIKD